ncbi:MAG: hypothetical protein H6624_05310 [Bdellovibrionaceae bacterium]|nr:hypothetical protein [Bdellovibrionales bacterium]MCB9083737.1 hypothetical protein [Pseudobdellovibrionaceae bacterium]
MDKVPREERMELMKLYSLLCHLGNIYTINIRLPAHEVIKELEPFVGDWKPYNPRKPGYKRFGLSLTSMDGGLSGVPDLDSVPEYNRINNTNYDEMDFNQPTEVLRACRSMAPLFETFQGELGRCHFLKFETGGFFPPHRDTYGYPFNGFRFLSIIKGDPLQYTFLLEGKQQSLHRGRVYFFNSMLEHAFFTYQGDVVILVMNVQLSEKAVTTVMKNLEIS